MVVQRGRNSGINGGVGLSEVGISRGAIVRSWRCGWWDL
jgi:hypothetical protein